MEDLTPEQIVELADSYRRTARALAEFQLAHWPELSYEQQLDLNAYQNSLLNRAQDLMTLSVRPAFHEAGKMIEAVRQATTDAQSGLKRIKNLTIALNVGAITVALAASIARANPKGIQTALNELGELLKMEE
ncbi:hypothetical protein BN8_02356 [Fibrisoma limi BUZ 3]|uniref:Uncharacterized protein n=1 Tax=Fibrisoma limi BUZ 3 TaxID=1185876 RepID=I2GH99_9BACT|nr:hypothetical protein [Fibrisoma limi]CCH53274.1 hypothetical protein BN8_02356 [Fibrisoma limi BUZ 3]